MSPTEISYERLRQEVLDEIQKHSIGVLATSEGNHVTARQMMFLFDGLTISCVTISHTRKYKQIMANPNVAVAFGNLQIEGVAELKGHPSEDQNAGFIKAFQAKLPQLYEKYREECEDPDTDFRVIEITPTRIAVYHGRPDFHLDIMYIPKKKAYKLDMSDMDSTYE